MKNQYDFVKNIYLNLKKRKELPPLKPLGVWNPEISIIHKLKSQIDTSITSKKTHSISKNVIN